MSSISLLLQRPKVLQSSANFLSNGTDATFYLLWKVLHFFPKKLSEDEKNVFGWMRPSQGQCNFTTKNVKNDQSSIAVPGFKLTTSWSSVSYYNHQTRFLTNKITLGTYLAWCYEEILVLIMLCSFLKYSDWLFNFSTNQNALKWA